MPDDNEMVYPNDDEMQDEVERLNSDSDKPVHEVAERDFFAEEEEEYIPDNNLSDDEKKELLKADAERKQREADAEQERQRLEAVKRKEDRETKELENLTNAAPTANDFGGVDFDSGDISVDGHRSSAVDIGDMLGGNSTTPKPTSIRNKIAPYTTRKTMAVILILAMIVFLACEGTSQYNKAQKAKLAETGGILEKRKKDKEEKGLHGADTPDVLEQSHKETVEELSERQQKYTQEEAEEAQLQVISGDASVNSGEGQYISQQEGQDRQPQHPLNNTQNGGQVLTPTSGNTSYDPSSDPIYQQKMALRQQYLELTKQSYTSKPAVEGEWQKLNEKHISGASLTNTGAPASSAQNTSIPELDKLARSYGFTNKEDALKALGGGVGNITPAQSSAFAQGSKESFFNSSNSGKGYLGNTRTSKISPYSLPAGTMIPCTLITGINSDLPGNIMASVTENVYDWQSAHVCLIPQGTRVFGTYNNSISFGQRRLQVTWQRLVYPDGSTISLEGMSGVDRRGYSGLKDKTYNHYDKMFVAAVFTTAFAILPALVENRRNDNSVYYGNSARDTAASQAANHIGQMGNKFFDRSLNVQPTILVRPGTRFNIQVNADIPFYQKWSSIR